MGLRPGRALMRGPSEPGRRIGPGAIRSGPLERDDGIPAFFLAVDVLDAATREHPSAARPPIKCSSLQEQDFESCGLVPQPDARGRELGLGRSFRGLRHGLSPSLRLPGPVARAMDR